ncbi:3-(3-hydroxy-phenyl)propionate transporter MhpT [Pseudomonas vancouverensis]|uniref:3-(3-hydroxy-phenyl)propionate transporter MhpT n=1 Tax=Pseudomonas vancouverensis TaxID=95300 RepID=A0A1H2ME21_PSEVA|nr:3-(3-hydroxy-phenyl)propionate transporter MhpT [Pseudomonas vancouverensis]KAB0499147.1 3-(3-hydroxy-phenyl)propionate transporter MhpT [Pseudomonas vancouverensis]TDB59871.1 3-(3-hydroxy-phenyl)propionate transporter MhpT [Pseudomonas vancouverensis]SDU91480.1 MFS transporter, AAHS family, 3-hydroxyphenylpropionic acid transporter [Pseudomonas vancouverensis]
MSKLSSSARSRLTIALCFCIAVFEGLDLQSAGIAAAGMRLEFGLSPQDLGAVFSAGILGLIPGSLFGGILADRYGRRAVLLWSIAIFGICSLLTAYAWNLPSLLSARLLTGVGLGAALPTVIALTAEAANERYRGRAVSLMFCGMPLGGALATMLGMEGIGGDWRTVFYVGGIAPLLLVPFLYALLPESLAFERNRVLVVADSPGTLIKSLFGPRRTGATLLMWVVFFFTLMVIYILLNWLPSLLMKQGLEHDQAAWVQAAFSFGAAAGSVILGSLLDYWRAEQVVRLMYAGMILALLALCLAESYPLLLAAGGLAGFFTIGGQLVLYTLATLVYPSEIRSTGLGFAVTSGRLGAMLGPLLVGHLLLQGMGSSAVIVAAIPCILVAALLAAFMLRKPQPAPTAA